MAKKWRDLFAILPPERQTAILQRSGDLERELRLAELRRARRRSQQRVAQELGVGQAAISKLERRADVYVSTLRKYVEALGGSLRIVASFPSGDIEITQFADNRRVGASPRKPRRISARAGRSRA
jgi:transcriptional regulator with XRE-family HTH domain